MFDIEVHIHYTVFNNSSIHNLYESRTSKQELSIDYIQYTCNCFAGKFRT